MVIKVLAIEVATAVCCWISFMSAKLSLMTTTGPSSEVHALVFKRTYCVDSAEALLCSMICSTAIDATFIVSE